MRGRIFSAIFMTALTATFIGTPANADSFCGFDEGLIGTKATGYVHPLALSTHNIELETCEITVFDTPDESSVATTALCTDFLNVPSIYLDESEAASMAAIESEYFRLQVFGSQDLWVQLAFKDGENKGEKKWVKKDYASASDALYQIRSDDSPVQIAGSHPSQAAIYDAPRLDKPARYMGQYMRGISDGWIDQTIDMSFFQEEVFQILKSHDLFDPNHIEAAKLATHYGDILLIGYEVTDIIQDEDGRQWLEAQEYLSISYWAFWDYLELALDAQDKELSAQERDQLDEALSGGEFRSKAGRTVYFPYREPSGTITMVMSDGPNCGC